MCYLDLVFYIKGIPTIKELKRNKLFNYQFNITIHHKKLSGGVSKN